MPTDPPGDKSKRRADRALVGAYHEAKLADLLEHVRAALAHYDAGGMSAFDVDEIIHQYTLAARELRKFCGVTSSQIKMTAATLVQLQQDGQERDWWEIARPRRP